MCADISYVDRNRTSFASSPTRRQRRIAPERRRERVGAAVADGVVAQYKRLEHRVGREHRADRLGRIRPEPLAREVERVVARRAAQLAHGQRAAVEGESLEHGAARGGLGNEPCARLAAQVAARERERRERAVAPQQRREERGGGQAEGGVAQIEGRGTLGQAEGVARDAAEDGGAASLERLAEREQPAACRQSRAQHPGALSAAREE
eukprot:2283280-Prymnesium_polylepis.2